MRRALLLVDDERSLLAIAARMTERLGFTALRATSGKEAIRLYREHASEVCGVLLDVNMPEMDGPAILRELRSINDQVKVVLCSGFIQWGQEKELERLGIDGFLAKPFTWQQFAGVVQAFFADDIGGEAQRGPQS